MDFGLLVVFHCDFLLFIGKMTTDLTDCMQQVYVSNRLSSI